MSIKSGYGYRICRYPDWAFVRLIFASVKMVPLSSLKENGASHGSLAGCQSFQSPPSVADTPEPSWLATEPAWLCGHWSAALTGHPVPTQSRLGPSTARFREQIHVSLHNLKLCKSAKKSWMKVCFILTKRAVQWNSLIQWSHRVNTAPHRYDALIELTQ